MVTLGFRDNKIVSEPFIVKTQIKGTGRERLPSLASEGC
jgi:hypothetical protein